MDLSLASSRINEIANNNFDVVVQDQTFDAFLIRQAPCRAFEGDNAVVDVESTFEIGSDGVGTALLAIRLLL